MPSVEENKATWGGSYEWAEDGDEWSAAWGDADTQWHCTVLPRIRRFVPASRILEIAPGHGRWSGYLISLSDHYIGIDLAADAIDACKRRFASVPSAEFHVNDGRSLAAVPDGSVDFAFSFDSLVHVEDDVIGAYLKELAQKLTPDGVAFLHHSNLGEHARAVAFGERLGDVLRRGPSTGWTHWRAQSMTASRMVELAGEAGLTCVGQELINWLGSYLIDCISVVARPGSKWHRPNVVVRNPFFMLEAASAARMASVYNTDRADNSERPIPARVSSASAGRYRFYAIGPWLSRRR